MMRRTRMLGGMALVLGLGGWAANAEEAGRAAGDAALHRTRKQVQMLDALYKTAIVTVTDKYVNKDSDVAAATSFAAVFDAMKKNGFHEVRLLDATGSPYDDDNLAKDSFEKEAIRQLKSGQATYEQIENGAQGRVLRVATAIPVVMKKCTMCHEAYEKAKPGEAIGALSYSLKIE